MSDKRVPFFLGSALLCALLVPLSDTDLRWVPVVTGVTYLVLALLVAVDSASRRRSRRRRGADTSDGRAVDGRAL